MNTTETIQVQETEKISPYLQWVNKNFVQNQPKCVQQNEAIFICTHAKCKKQNPFVCNTLDCKCHQCHQDCSIRNTKSFLKEFQTRYQYFSSQLEENVQKAMDSLIEKISIAKQSFLQRIRQNRASQFILNNQKARKKDFQQILKKELTGSLIAQLLLKDLSNENQSQLDKFNSQFTEIVKKFQTKLESFLVYAKQRLFLNVDQIICSRNLKSSYVDLTSTGIKRSSGRNGQRKIILLEPGISKLLGNIIKWNVKIEYLSNSSCIGLGICLRQLIKKKEFQIKGTNEECYLVLNNEKVYDPMDQKKNNNNGYGIEFIQKDIIEIELDKFRWILKFKNLRTTKSTQLKITKIPELNQDDYHICVALGYQNDQVEIVSPIETSLHKYPIKTNQF